jgi:transporter family-2 protein
MTAGALLAITVVGGNAIIAPVLGTGIATIMNLIGMMGGGLVIDATGFLGIEKQPATMAKIIGMFLMIAGTAMISLM